MLEQSMISNTNIKDQMYDNDEAKEWKECFFNKTIKVVNPSDSRLESVKQKNDPVQFYSVYLSTIEGLSKRLSVIIFILFKID
jgi:hypothetical protein